MLRDLKIERKYASDSYDDPYYIVDHFYVPCMSNCTRYSRLSGFFSSSSLAVASKGIVNLIDGGGCMRLVTSPRLSKEDIRAIEQGQIEEERILENFFSANIFNEGKIIDEHVEALGWLIANKKLEIRIVVMLNNNGNLIDYDSVTDDSLFHPKVGIFEDATGDKVSFSGSINESATGWTQNIESFSVFCNWKSEDQNDYSEDYVADFERYWTLGPHIRCKTVEFPEAVRNQWIKVVPQDKTELRLFKNKRDNSIKVFDYQQEAIDSWSQNSYCGIFNMATGTGKTITSIFALKQLIETLKSKIVVVVAVPLQHLIEDPWIKTLDTLLTTDSFEPNFVRAFNSSAVWQGKASKAIENYKFGVTDNIFFVTTYNTLSSENFISMIHNLKGKKILIADEVHNSGSNLFREGLIQDYSYRLGLSATPARYLDEHGTTFIQDYFDKEIYSFSLQRAITEINPLTGESYLTPYYYRPIFISLTQDEIDEYDSLSAKLVKYIKPEMTPHDMEIVNYWLIKRARITKNAENKLTYLKNAIPDLYKSSVLDRCIIYCSDGKDSEEPEVRTRSKVIEYLNDNKIMCSPFTSSEKHDERMHILEDFASGELKVLVAIKCLDEGVDVPSTRNAIIMASTGNPREYIQRRGRVLRRSPGKKYATIYDYIVVPNDDLKNIKTEIKIFRSEYRRFTEFSDYSLNKAENESIIQEIMDKFSIKILEDDENEW